MNSQHKNNDIIHTYDISLVGYLNDTTWFGSSQQQIEEKLSIANSFYDLNNIKVNMDKYRILTNDRSIKQSTITLTINNQQYDAPIMSRNKSERILGLYINTSDRHTQTIQKGRQIMKSQLNILRALFNTPVLRNIAIQKIYNTVSEIWYPRIPHNINDYTDLVAKPTYLTKMLGLSSNYGFSFNFTFDINILGGNTPIRDYMSDLTAADIQSLKAKNIIYMDQVMSSDGNYLLSWPDVKRNNNDNYKENIPAWYNNLANNYVLSNNLRLIHPLNDVVSNINRIHKSPQLILAISEPKFQWTIHWNNTQKQVIFGKTLSQDTDRSTSISYLQHYIPQQTHHDINLTPKRQLLGLVACKGCLLHSYYPHDAHPTCVIAIRTQRLLLFNTFKKSSVEHKSLLEFYNRQPFVVATKPFHTLRHIAYENFIKIDKSL
uniref:Uncharacterized protein n=1 Tax=Rhizophagus irregularis (strain DAOM 181602 / DAOM 197198 / MUCL 43194) TaxID=747089 RepID=U9TQZ6_RHIID